jgi:hypothetical protein
MLDDIWVTCLILRFVSRFEFGFAGHQAISTGQFKAGDLQRKSIIARPVRRHLDLQSLGVLCEFERALVAEQFDLVCPIFCISSFVSVASNP